MQLVGDKGVAFNLKFKYKKNNRAADENRLIFYALCDKIITACQSILDGFPSGQRGQTVNLLQIASVVRIHHHPYAGVAELADAQDLKSCGPNRPYRFDSGRRQ